MDDQNDVRDPRDTLAALLREAGRAHHIAFAHVNGEDAEWPSWYAAWLLPRLTPLLGRVPGVDALAAELHALEEERRALEPAPDWPGFYAERLLARDWSAPPHAGTAEARRRS